MRRVTKFLVGCLALAVGLVCWQRVHMPEDISKRQPVVALGSAEFVRVASVANKFVAASGSDWGQPARVEWQSIHGRYVVSYATPDSEMLVLGRRAVHVDEEGKVWFVPRG